MQKLKLYRKRYIPDEMIELKNDLILHANDSIIVTKWKTINPKKDFSHGVSCYFLQKGWKISKFLDNSNNCVYTYCDIIESMHNEDENSILVNDLLVDIVVYNNGLVEVVDIGDVADALEQGLISVETAAKALRQTDSLLRVIHEGRLPELTGYLPV
jgi:predicted RNA-binding protein associated with RNAse of E/G family